MYYKQSKNTEALSIQHEVLDIRLKTFGAEHPLAADTLYNISKIYESQKLFESAAESFEQSAAIYSQVYEDTHQDTIDAQQCAESVQRSLADA